MRAYYNEFDPKAAAWLRELIKRGLIAPGEVDERSIVDVRAGDLAGFSQHHFFAGIGVWSYALRKAGWADDRPVWTGSCPCQPFSAAGKRGGTDDHRHLWPEFFRLIAECRPVTVFGEQVASKDGLAWLDAVHADLEGANYAVGAVDICAAGFGAPHIRQRLYFVADAERERTEWRSTTENGSTDTQSGQSGELPPTIREDSAPRLLADADLQGSQVRGRAELSERTGECAVGENGGVGGVLDDSSGAGQLREIELEDGGEGASRRGATDPCEAGPRATNGFWRDAVWIPCRDGKARPVEPGIFPLVNGAPARVVRLRGYGNGLVAPQAQAFIESYMEVLDAADSTAK